MKKTSRNDNLPIPHSDNEVLTVGLDLGDRTTNYCVLNSEGDIAAEGSLRSSPAALHKYFASLRPCRVALEVGGHSRWVSSLLNELGFEVIVANASQVSLFTKVRERLTKSMREL